MARPRGKKKTEQESLGQQPPSTVPDESATESLPFEPPGDEMPVARTEEQGAVKQWAKPPNPFPSIGYYWQDYAIRYQENQERNEVQIKFGDGSADAKPINFEKIEPLLRSNGMRWNSKDKAWGLALEWQVKLTEEGAAQANVEIRRRNARSRAQIENLLPEIVQLEEEARGPATGMSQKPPEAAL